MKINNDIQKYLLQNNIILIGFMGSGKSYFGDYLASFLQNKLIDTDKLIETAENMPISDIFKIKGENYFRLQEKKVLQDIVFTSDENEKIILVTGGGLPLKKANQKLLKLLNPLIICLNPPFEVILSRIRGTKRPMVYRRSRKYIFNLWAIRYAVYQKIAHISISEESIEGIIQALNERVRLYM